MRRYGNSFWIGLAMLLMFSMQSVMAAPAKQSASKKLVAYEKKTSAKRYKPAKAGARTAPARAARVPVRKKLALKTIAIPKRSSRQIKPVRSTKRMVARASTSVKKGRHWKARSAPLAPIAAAAAGAIAAAEALRLHSSAAYIIDSETSGVLFQKNADIALPIASLTKLMTGLVVVEAGQDMNEVLEVTTADRDLIKHTSSRLPFGAKLSRKDMLHIALMSSENRAASALGRHYPGGINAFVAAMNAKARSLGMVHTRYVDSTGLSSGNVATARDLAKLVTAAADEPQLSRFSTNEQHSVAIGKRELAYVNSNRLIGRKDWDVELQKTGYIQEAGRCLLMQAKVQGRSVIMIFLNAKDASARAADAIKVKSWVSPRLADRSMTLATNDTTRR